MQFRHILLSINRTSNRVLTTVIGINKAPDMERAVMPKEIACRAVSGSSRLKTCFNQCNDEKYRPTPGITLVIDCELIFIIVINANPISNYMLILQDKDILPASYPSRVRRRSPFERCSPPCPAFHFSAIYSREIRNTNW